MTAGRDDGKRGHRAHRGPKCPACDGMMQYDHEGVRGVYCCKRCGAVHGQCYLGESYEIVLPYFDPRAAEVKPEATRHFDLTTLGSAGVGRRHGWYNPETRMIVQVG